MIVAALAVIGTLAFLIAGAAYCLGAPLWLLALYWLSLNLVAAYGARRFGRP